MNAFHLPLSKEELVLHFVPEGMPAEAVEQVAARLDPEPVVFSARTRVMVQGEPGDAMFFLAEGEVDVTVTPFGAGSPYPPVKVARLSAGDLIGEMAVVQGQMRSATVTAVGEVTAYRLSRDNWIYLKAFFPGLAFRIEELAKQRAKELAEPRKEGSW